MKLTKAQVKKNIHQQTINGEIISYSYAQKCQATLSMLKNDRLLVFNEKTGVLFYINEPTQLPFTTQIPKPKKQWADINISIVKNPPETNDLIIQFAMKNQKNQQVSVQWSFVFQNQPLVKQWMAVIQKYKARKIEEMQKQQKKQPQKNENASSRAFIHDTLGFGALQGLKKQDYGQEGSKPQIKEQQNLRRSNLGGSRPNIQNKPEQLGYSKINDSKLSPEKPVINIKPVEPSIENSNIRQSNLANSNIGYSNINSNIGRSNINGENLKKSTLDQENLRRSQQGSPQLQKSNLNLSKLTLRDQLESILQRSHLRQSQFSNYGNDNRNTDKNYDPKNDWNLKFLKKQDQSVLLDFQIFAEKSFFTILNEDQRATQSLRCYYQHQIIILVADARSLDAKKLKAQFRNYHFIMESCKYQFIVGVPLASLIEFQGLVALVKSTIPDAAVKLQLTQSTLMDLKDLERYTRIKNGVLKKAALFDLSEIYDSKGKRLIYIDNLFEYLPVHIQENYRGGTIRPEHILDNVNTFMQGGLAQETNRQDMKILNQALDLIRVNVRQLAKQLSSQDVLFASCLQLKTIMHQKGINLKYLPMLNNEVTNKNVKKYITTIMVAKVAKDDILQNLASLRIQNAKISMSQTVENSMRLLVEGNTSVSNELWKQIAINFRKQYNVPMSNHDIIGPYFLSCLMSYFPAKYDLSKLNRKKNFFKDEGIVAKGFLIELYPKTKSYYRYTSELTDKIELTCKADKLKENFDAMVLEMELKAKPIPQTLNLSKTNENLKEYMSFYASPSEFDSKSFPHLNIFRSVNVQPPTSISLSITKNYLDWCLDSQKFDDFKKILESSLAMIDFWFDQNHPYHCDFYETLSNYYELNGSIDQSINFSKESLAICIRSGGVTSKKTGYKYFDLAQKELRAGRKNDSRQNFIKAKNNMENKNQKTIKYPITLMKLSSLFLNASEFQNCIIYSKQAVEKFEQLQSKNKSASIPKSYYDQYCIKAIQIMTRAFQIENKKNQFYKIAQLASAKYNKTKNAQVFEQLLKICLTGVIFKHNLQKCQVFQSFIEKLSLTQNTSSEKCLDELMLLAEQFNVMERFMFKFQSLQRIASDINSRRALSADAKEFITITKNMVGAIGEDYVYGLIQQKQFQ